MPQRDVRLPLQDVIDACDLISRCLDGKTPEAILAHGYHLIDHGVVWVVATTVVPLLRSTTAQLISERA